jgi:iron complex transport system substrate-binding protein
VDRLQALGLPVLALEPRNWADTRRVIATVAQALGEPAAGDALVAAVQARIAAAAAQVPARLRGRSVYFEVAATPFAAGASSFVGELLAGLGLLNIVPGGLGPFPQLNPEFVMRAQPALIMASADELAQMTARPGWPALRALRQRQTCGFAPAEFDTLMRAGPRLGDAAWAIAACLRQLEDAP